MSFFAASCFMFCRVGLFEFGTSVSSLTVDGMRRLNAAALCSAWLHASIGPSHQLRAVQPAPALCWSSNG